MIETYHFVTNWRFKAPIERVWQKFVDVEAYPNLWSGMRKATIRGPESKIQVGSIVDFSLKGSLPKRLDFSTRVTMFQPPNLMELKSSGDLVGYGKLVLEYQVNQTAVTFYWDVGITNPFFNLVGKIPFIKTIIMEKSHNDVMAIAYEIFRSSLE